MQHFFKQKIFQYLFIKLKILCSIHTVTGKCGHEDCVATGRLCFDWKIVLRLEDCVAKERLFWYRDISIRVLKIRISIVYSLKLESRSFTQVRKLRQLQLPEHLHYI